MDGLIKVAELVAATWYLSYVLTNKGGPLNLFARAREAGGGRWHGRTIEWTINKSPTAPTYEQNGQPGLLDCIICIAPYVALVLWLINSDYLTIPFAIAGLALWAHSYTGWIHFGGK